MKLGGGKTAVINYNVFEDNNGSLTTDDALKMTPRTKHTGVKYHLFKVSLWRGQCHQTRQG